MILGGGTAWSLSIWLHRGVPKALRRATSFSSPFFPFFSPSDVSQQSLLHLNIGQVDSHWFPQTRSNGSLCRVRNRKITKEKNIKGPLSPTPSDLAPQMYGPHIYKEEVASANIR